MPVSNLTVTNTSGVPYDQWSLLAGANKTVAVQTNDGLTSYIADGNVGHRQCWNVGWPTDVGGVNSIKAQGYVRRATADDNRCAIGVRNSGGETDYNPGALSESFTQKTSGSLARPGGGSWTAADCASGVTWLQIRQTQGGAAGNAQCTELHMILDYSLPGAAFITFWSWLGPLLGSALTFDQFCGALDLVARVHPTIRAFSARDKREMWRAFCAWQRPAFAF